MTDQTPASEPTPGTKLAATIGLAVEALRGNEAISRDYAKLIGSLPPVPPARERIEHDLQLACDTLNSISTNGAPREIYLLTVALTALTRAVRTMVLEQPEDRRDD